ncbi:hypothetical protein BD410DRAFT_586674 [Rickenella mellea]|uniref:Uncharacterized protein n=1 Tax=Rickenella mellea TaxID=50990 RepID=A0A4Y7PP50_9AGAM|nr:hypothetical protein BD410DRAFT_586674 [Rickenella mellea]
MAGGSGGFANSSGSGSGSGFGVFGARYEWAGEWEQEQEQGGGDMFVQVVTPETFVLDNLGCENDSESDGDEEEDVEDVGDLDWNDVRMDADAVPDVPEEMPLEAETHSYDTKTQVGMEIVLEESDPYPPAILTQISPSPSPSSSSSHIHTPHFGRQIQRIDIPPLRTFPIPQYEFCHPIKGRGTPGRGRAWEEWMRVAVMSPGVGMEIDGPSLLNGRILDASGNTHAHSRGSQAQESGPVPALATAPAPAPQHPEGPGSIHGMDVPGPYEDAAKFEAFVAQINARGYTPPPHPYAHSHPESNHLTRSPSDIYHHHVQNSNHIHDAPRKMTTGAGPTLAIAALIPSIPSTTLQHALGFASHLGSPLHDAQGRGVPSSTVTADAGFDRGDAITVDVHVLNDLNTTQFGGALEEGEGSYVLPDTPNKPGSPSNPPSVLQFDLPATEVLLSSATELMEIAHDIQV